MCVFADMCLMMQRPFLDGYCSTVQGLLDWFEVDLGFPELFILQIYLCTVCFFGRCGSENAVPASLRCEAIVVGKT